MLVRPYTHGIQVYLNKTMISQVGDFERRSANIWNSVLTVHLPEHLLLEENHLELVFASWYDVGLGASPYLQEYKKVVIRERLTRFLDQEFYLIVIGACLIIGVIVRYHLAKLLLMAELRSSMTSPNSSTSSG